jgi:Uma2 family endonuclease
VANGTLARLTKQDRKKFLRLAPEFVVEVMSPSDHPRHTHKKMELWLANGVQLAWLIDGDSETVHIYQQGAEPRVRRHAREVAGTGPVAGFVLKLGPIWRGL